MRSKLKHLREFLRQDEDRYYPIVPKAFVDYCEEGGDIPPGLLETQTHKFRFYFTKWPNLQHPSHCIMDLDGQPPTKYSHRSFQVAYNSIQEKLFQRFYGSVPGFDNDWFYQNDVFLQKLPTRLRFALVAMTNKSQQHIQAHLKNEDMGRFHARVRKWNQPVHGYLPIFFPLYEKHKKKLAGLSLSMAYQKIIASICPRLTGEEIEECIVELVKDVRHVFSICPKTTKRMTLWRGLRSTPSLSYTGFTSMSLDPFHTLNYTGNDCCLQKITLLPGTPLLFIGGLSSFKKEMECILPDNLQFYEIKKSSEIIPIVHKMKDKCPSTKETRRILIQHIVVL